MPRRIRSNRNRPSRTAHRCTSGRRRRRGDESGAGSPINLTGVSPVPLGRLEPGVVVWAHVPFADMTAEKSRPAVVVCRRGRDVTLRPITSSTRRFVLRDHIEVIDLEAAGLGRRSAVLEREVTVDRIEITSICGELSEADRARALRIAERTN